jgi:hypothetical protein
MKRFTFKQFIAVVFLFLFAVGGWAQTTSEYRNGVLVFYDKGSDETIYPMARVKYYEEFTQTDTFGGYVSGATPTSHLTFTGVNGAEFTIVSATDGESRMTTGSADDDNVELATELVWRASQSITAEARIKLSTTALGFNFGFSDAITEGADDLAFEVDVDGATGTSNASNAALIVSDGDQTSNLIRGIAVDSDTDGTLTSSGISADTEWHLYRVEINTDGDVSFWVDGDHFYTAESAITLNAPLCVYMGAINRNSSAGASTMDVDYIWAWQKDR